ncbi:MAG: SoxR reducing system RseC family protein [Cellvibrionaceae bacterium]
MLKETGRVVAVDNDSVWVETINQSTCGTCSAKKGCGQSTLAKWSAKQSYLRVLLDGRDPESVRINDSITVGIPEDVVVKSSLLLYCLPIVLMLLGTIFADAYFENEILSVCFAVIGFIAGGVFVSLFSRFKRNDRRSQPVIIELISSSGVAN